MKKGGGGKKEGRNPTRGSGTQVHAAGPPTGHPTPGKQVQGHPPSLPPFSTGHAGLCQLGSSHCRQETPEGFCKTKARSLLSRATLQWLPPAPAPHINIQQLTQSLTKSRVATAKGAAWGIWKPDRRSGQQPAGAICKIRVTLGHPGTTPSPEETALSTVLTTVTHTLTSHKAQAPQR